MNNKAPQSEIKMHGFFMPKIAFAPGENRTVLPERVIGLRASKGARHFSFKALFLASLKGKNWAIPQESTQGYAHDLNKTSQLQQKQALTLFFLMYRSLHKIHSKNRLKSGNKVLTIKPNGYLACSAFLFLLICNLAFADLPAQGEASFYTIESCHREGTSGITASGEPLNNRMLTCALPSHYYIGKRIRVTNIKNHKSVIVRCTDYGPNARLVYEHNRIIDLSQAAFMKIANLDDGIAQVKIEVLP
jgi:rare lipoprotein A